MSLFGVALNVTTNRIKHEIRTVLRKDAWPSLKALVPIFRKFDPSGSKIMNFKQFEAALAQCGLFLKIVDIQALMKYYDADQYGGIPYEEFIAGLREPMSEERLKAVEKIYAMLDRNKTGKIKIEDIEKYYSVENHPDFISGKKTREELVQEFIANFADVVKDGEITKEDFFNYFADLSTMQPDDEGFVEMAEGSWEEAEEKETPMVRERVDFLIKAIRGRLLTLAKTQDEYYLRRLLDEYDTDKSGGISIDEFVWLLIKLGIAVEKKYVLELFKRFDLNKSGAIDYEEFCSFLIHNPYTKWQGEEEPEEEQAS